VCEARQDKARQDKTPSRQDTRQAVSVSEKHARTHARAITVAISCPAYNQVHVQHMYLIIMQHAASPLHLPNLHLPPSATIHSDKVAGLTIALSSSLQTSCLATSYGLQVTAHSLKPTRTNPHRRHSCPANALDCPPACRTFTSAKSPGGWEQEIPRTCISTL
jgi:hypothetical protein